MSVDLVMVCIDSVPLHLPPSQHVHMRADVYLKVKVEVSIGVKELGVKAVNESNGFLDLTFQNHFPDLYPLIKRVQIHIRLNPGFHTELLCSLFKSLCGTETCSEGQFMHLILNTKNTANTKT